MWTIKVGFIGFSILLQDVMFGGTETVALTIEWAMAELMKNPKELKKVQAELSNVVGLDRRLQDSDLKKLTYLKCTIKETLRLHPPIPFLLHETTKDAVLTGHSILAGCRRVLINVWAIGRDGKTWDEPNEFKPLRFSKDGAKDFKGCDFEFTPFGSGRRACPGMQLGLYALEMSVAELVHCFTWELQEGMKASEIDMSDVFGLTARVTLVAVPKEIIRVANEPSFLSIAWAQFKKKNLSMFIYLANKSCSNPKFRLDY